MKRLLLLLALVPILLAGCTQGEPVEDLWTESLYPATNNTYTVGSPTYQYANGYFVNLSTSGSINTSGDLFVSGNVTADFFIGDGSQLTGIEQGELILYFLNEDSPDIVGQDRLSSDYNSSEVTLTGAALGDGSTLMGTWITDNGSPAKNLLAGNLRVHVTGRKTLGTKNAQFYYEVYKCNESGTELELLSTSEYTNILTAVRTDYRIWALLPETNLNTSDRIKVKGYAFVSGGGSAPSVEAYIQGASNTRLVLPVGAVSVEKFVPYTGAVHDLYMGIHNVSANYFIGNGSFLTGSWSLGNFSNINVLSGGHIWIWDADNSDNFHLSHDGGVGIIENPTGDIYVRADHNVVADLTGDSAGLWEWQVENSNNHEVASIDTLGNLDVEGYIANLNMSIRADGTIVPVSMADASAPNNSIYYSTTAGKLVYKDAAGNVNSLY